MARSFQKVPVWRLQGIYYPWRLFISSKSQTCRRTNTSIIPVDLVIPIPQKMLQVLSKRTDSMNQRFLFKTLFQVIVICILVTGVALANTDCQLVCCGHCESQGLPFGSAHPEHDMHGDCSSGPVASPCHLKLKFVPVAVEFDSFGDSQEENPTEINFATAGTGIFLLVHSNQYFAYLVKLQTKAASVPLYFRNSSLLF